ncbi:MAG TPA: LacI family DNA-binding transcriptional regulator [Euzebyales bacterium]|nr:LacI family DNA-binding transcriptional regulator [Euzebyales bacterium]
MPPRLVDVARRAGVSLSTASRVLGGSRDRVTPQLRNRVLAAAAELNYVPNAPARALARATTPTLGLIVHDVSDPYFAEIARGVLRVADDAGLMVMICNSHRDPERELDYIQALRSQRVQAIVLAGSGYRDVDAERDAAVELRAFEASGGRAAVVGRHRLPVDAVLPDNADGGSAMGKVLTDLGHERIGVVAGPPGLTTVEDRLRGFREALSEAGVDLPASAVVHADFTRDGGWEATARLLDVAPDVTGIFALNDAMAVGALAALRHRRIGVPGRMSLAGFDDIPIASDVDPALTTVRLPMVHMGAEAVRLTLRARSGRPRRRRLVSEVITRDSTGPPR